MTHEQLKAISAKRVAHAYSPAQVPDTSLSDLNRCQSYYAVADIVYSMNQTKREDEPLVRLRETEAWERANGGGRYVVCLYDLAKNLEGDAMACGSITEARGWVLGILATRRFRRTLKIDA